MIHIFTSVVNRPNFLIIQDKLFKKFLKDQYKFHVIDDSVQEKISEQFKDICFKNKLLYYKKPRRKISLSPAQSCADAVQWAYDMIIKNNHKNDIILFCDSDMFLVDEFSVEEYMANEIISGLPQKRGNVTYMWNGIMFFNMPKIYEIDPNIDFSDGMVEGELTDVGGYTYYYFKKNKITFKETDVSYPDMYEEIQLQNDSITKGYNFELHLDGKFLHYRAATNWHLSWKSSKDPLEHKTKIFEQIVERILLD